VDRIVECELSPEEAKGLRPLSRWHVVQQAELVEKPFVITEYRARRYRDPRTGRIVIASLPPEVAAAGLVGPRLSAAIAFQKAACHMSYTTIQAFWRDLAGLDLSRGQLAKVVQKVSAAICRPYEELRDNLAEQERLGIDESGHKDAGRRHWTWCFRAPQFTVFHIDRSRGSEVLRAVLGEMFGGVIGCDYFSAYHKYMADSGATVQFCMAHLIRDIRFLAEQTNKSVVRWAKRLLDWLRKLFYTLHRKDRWPLEKFMLRMEAIRRGFLQQVRHPPMWSEAQTLAARFRGGLAESYFTFLTEPGVEPTNNLTEQAIRHVVIDRRVTQGTRGDRGMRWCERAWSVLATCAQQGCRVFQFLYDALLAHLNAQPAPSLLS
jgi:transposase